MAERRKLLLIIAQSGQMLAQSAAREGYTVRVADCFGDLDMLQVADRYLKLPPLEQISEQQWLDAIISLSEEQPCFLICGTGIERFYPVISQLPAYIEYTGTDVASLEQICLPKKWFALLEELDLPYPPTQFHKAQIGQGKWLAKSSPAWGGVHISNASLVKDQPGRYYQQQVQGMSASALFLIRDGQNYLLLLNQQFTRNIDQDDFSLLAIISGLKLNSKQQLFLHQTLQKLTQRLALSGLISLDFIIHPTGEINLLEINPRPTASCQLLPAELPIIDWQLAVSTVFKSEYLDNPFSEQRLLWFCFASQQLTIPDNFDWPGYCHDLPPAKSIIKKGEIICSVLLSDENVQLSDARQLAHQLIENLSATA